MRAPEDGPSEIARPESLSEWFHTWRYLFWLLALAVLVFGFYAEENWRGHHAWEKYAQKMTARGEPFTPEAFIPVRVPDDENFAMTPGLASLFQFVGGTQRWINTNAPGLYGDILVRYDAAAGLVKSKSGPRENSWVNGPTDLGAWATAFSRPANEGRRQKEPLVPANYSPSDAAASVLNALSDFGPILEELRTASKRPYARFNIRYEEENPAGILLPHLSKIKHLCQVLQLRASAEIALGRTDDALQDLEFILYLADTTKDEPILISQLVRMTEVQMALLPLADGMGRWSDTQLQAIQQRLQSLDLCASTKRALQAERTLFGGRIIEYAWHSKNKLQLIDEFARVGVDGGGELWPVGLLLAVSPGGWLYFEKLNNARMFDERLLPLIDLQMHQIRPEAVRDADTAVTDLAAGSPVSKFLHHRFFASLLLPAVSKVAQKAAFAQTAMDTASLACAIERFRLANGKLPNSLEELTPRFSATTPHDIITGNPLTYRPGENGHFVLYSVGWNEKDDGGSPKSTKGGEMDQREGDWVWSDAF